MNITKTLKFKDELAKAILAGKKNVTWRLFDEKDLQVNDDLMFINKDTQESFARAKILSVREVELGQLTDEDWEGHEKYSSPEEMYKVFQSYYPGESVDENTIVKIIEFELRNS